MPHDHARDVPYWKDMMVQDEAAPHLGGNFHGGDSKCITPTLWRYLIDRFAVRSVLDIGSGEGHAAHFFYAQGLASIAIDGLSENVANAVYPVCLHDLNTGPFRVEVDMTHCVEVVEHVAEEHVDHLLDTLCNGKVIVMTHADVGQSGHHHVNCQPAEYWINKLTERGYRLVVDLDNFKRLARQDIENGYFEQTGLIFIRKPGAKPV